MPILDVEIVALPGEQIPPGISAAVADAAASVLGTPPGRTWVLLHVLPRECYAENGGGPDPGIQPVFVHVIKAALPAEQDLALEASALAAAIARACNRPAENVHIIYDPPAAGRIAFGGKLLRRDDGA